VGYRPWEIVLGGCVLAAAIGFAVFAVQGAGTRLSEPPGYALTGSFRSAEGVRPGTEVRLAGVRVGLVTGMDLDPESFRAQVRIRIDERLRLPADSTLAVASEGLLGGVFLEILPGGLPFDLEPGSAFEDTQSAVGLVQLLLRAFAGGPGDAAPGSGAADDGLPDSGSISGPDDSAPDPARQP
jgi:phospholipid/cholesterol/gamma-HCH transport system substrate-binding protein